MIYKFFFKHIFKSIKYNNKNKKINIKRLISKKLNKIIGVKINKKIIIIELV